MFGYFRRDLFAVISRAWLNRGRKHNCFHSDIIAIVETFIRIYAEQCPVLSSSEWVPNEKFGPFIITLASWECCVEIPEYSSPDALDIIFFLFFITY